MFPIKQAAINSKVNAILAVENKMVNIYNLFFFRNFGKELYELLGVHPLTAKFFTGNIGKEEKEKPRREGRQKISFQIGDERIVFHSCNKRLHEPTGEDIATDSYCIGTTNDQFVILNLDREEVFAMIEGIELDGDRIVFRRANFPHNPAVDIAALTYNYRVWISSWGHKEFGNWDDIKEKVVCFCYPYLQVKSSKNTFFVPLPFNKLASS